MLTIYGIYNYIDLHKCILKCKMLQLELCIWHIFIQQTNYVVFSGVLRVNIQRKLLFSIQYLGNGQ